MMGSGQMSTDKFVTTGPAFDVEKLDRLLEEVDIDVVLVSSKHNIQYLLGGYRFHFYSYMDAQGLSRYLPFFIYVRGNLNKAAYIGHFLENNEKDLGKFWVFNTNFNNVTTKQYASATVDFLKKNNLDGLKIGIEPSFLPVDAHNVLENALTKNKLRDATFPLELLRTIKTPQELEIVKAASEKVVDSMSAVFSNNSPGKTKNELINELRKEEQSRGLFFEYCLCNIGTEFNRSPSDQVWQEGEVLCLDSGGNYNGYIGDLARMGYAGYPDSELEDLLGFIEEVQQIARKPIKPGALGGEIYIEPDKLIKRSSFKNNLEFVAHGMGIVSHEGPWLTDRCSVPYEAYHAGRALEKGMVISIETTLHHSKRGFIKLEDTIAVTESGWESYGDSARGWNA